MAKISKTDWLAILGGTTVLGAVSTFWHKVPVGWRIIGGAAVGAVTGKKLEDIITKE